MQFAVSRRREALADVSGVALTALPAGPHLGAREIEGRSNRRALRFPRYGAPLDRGARRPRSETKAGSRGLGRLFNTHPPLEERIAALREL